MTLEKMFLSELKKKSPADLLKMAEELEIENASSMRKGNMLFGILKALMDHPGVTLSRARIAELSGRGHQRSNTRTIDVVVGRLRKKIEDDFKAAEGETEPAAPAAGEQSGEHSGEHH